jgi:hypothetical protein
MALASPIANAAVGMALVGGATARMTGVGLPSVGIAGAGMVSAVMELTGLSEQPGIELILRPSACARVKLSGQAPGGEGQHLVPHTPPGYGGTAVGRAAVERPQLPVGEAQGGIDGEEGRESEFGIGDVVIGARHPEGPGHPLAVQD